MLRRCFPDGERFTYRATSRTGRRAIRGGRSAGPRQRRTSVASPDAQPARVHRDLARHQRVRAASWRSINTSLGGAVARRRGQQRAHRAPHRGRGARRSDEAAVEHDSPARRRSGSTVTETIAFPRIDRRVDRLCRRSASRSRAAARDRSTIARCTSTPPARRARRRPRSSATRASCSGVTGSPG